MQQASATEQFAVLPDSTNGGFVPMAQMTAVAELLSVTVIAANARSSALC